MNLQAQRDISRKLKVFEHAAKSGNIAFTCRHSGISRDTCISYWLPLFALFENSSNFRDFISLLISDNKTILSLRRLSFLNHEKHVRTPIMINITVNASTPSIKINATPVDIANAPINAVNNPSFEFWPVFSRFLTASRLSRVVSNS